MHLVATGPLHCCMPLPGTRLQALQRQVHTAGMGLKRNSQKSMQQADVEAGDMHKA